MPAGERLDHVFQSRRIAQRDHVALTLRVERIAVPVGHRRNGIFTCCGELLVIGYREIAIVLRSPSARS